MLKILFIGDISGKIGRKTVAKILPKIKKQNKVDFVIANADNVAHGSGVTESTLKELQDSGVDYFTNGDHCFRKTNQIDECYKNFPIIRPANYSANVPGNGYGIAKIKKHKILIINLVGRVFMKMDYDCPFKKIDEILANTSLLKEKPCAIIIDIHAETTSEKIALKYYIDGKASALLGTHTHVMTADHEITKNKMAYITDVGMVGSSEGCLGIDKKNIIKTFLTQIKYSHEIPEKGEAIFNSVLITINPKTRKATAIKPITKFIKIN